MTSDVSSRILYKSDACVVVNKLSGEAVEGAGQGMGDLPRMLAVALDSGATLAGGDRLALPEAIHRLDVPVTGCVTFALTRSALAFLNTAFSGGETFADKETKPAVPGVEKHYWAIVEAPSGGGRKRETPGSGTSIPEAGKLAHWIYFDSRKKKSIAYDGPGPGRKKAVLSYRLVGKGQNYLFLDIELITGRHHQIRAQLARLGLHIKGDLKYGARRSEKSGGIRLHARSLSFTAPSGERIMVRAEPPLRDNLWMAFEEIYSPKGARTD